MYNIFLNKYYSKKVKSLYLDIQDIWPHSLSSVFKKNIFFDKILMVLKSYIFKSFTNTDRFFIVSQSYTDYFSNLLSNIPKSVIYIGADLNLIESIEPKSITNKDKINFFYIGTLSFSYDIKTAITAFIEYHNSGKNYDLHIFGNGPDELKLKNISTPNIHFYGNLSYNSMISYCKSFDIALNLIASGAPQSVTNKLSDYFLLNKLIISSKGCLEVEELIILSGGALYVSEDVNSLTSIINNTLRNNLHINRKINETILNHFDRSRSYYSIFKILQES